MKGLLTVPFAPYRRGLVVHHCPLRFRSFQQAVYVGGITVRPGDVLHADAEGVIKIPKGALEQLADRATQMRGFEREAHRILRQTGLASVQKRDQVFALLAKYGFAGPASREKR